MRQIPKRKSRVIKIGSVAIGGDYPVAIQSMIKVKTSNIERATGEIKTLEEAGCEIVRVAVRDNSDAVAIKKIKPHIRIPLVADIHFDYRLALAAIENGADKIRLNPGNIYRKKEVGMVVSALKQAHIPLRVGVNSGSVDNAHFLRLPMSERLIMSALGYISQIEKLKFYDIVISLKGSSVFDTTQAYRKVAKLCDYPLHLGVTATGAPYSGAIKSSIALGVLLLEGIGDTIRVSLTDTSKQEVKTARTILEAVNRRHFGPEIISCPTCGRCEVDLVKMVKELESSLSRYPVIPLSRVSTGKRANGQTGKHIKVAIMGCVVNGPGEAKEADMGVAFGKSEGVLFKNGKVVKKITAKDCVQIVLREITRRRVYVPDVKR